MLGAGEFRGEDEAFGIKTGLAEGGGEVFPGSGVTFQEPEATVRNGFEDLGPSIEDLAVNFIIMTKAGKNE
jgi:hypothetical protein